MHVTKLLPLRDRISPGQRPLVISHRGDWRYAPENSIEAMMLAAEGGADMVELDVQRTSDGELYMMHDDTTDRMTDRIGDTVAMRAEDFDTVRLRAGAGGPLAPMTDLPVPRLADVLQAARGRVHLNLDTKHRRDLEAVGAMVAEAGMSAQVLIKMTIDPADPDLSIREAPWFRHLTFMPVMLAPRPGQLAADVVALCAAFDAQMIEISFPSLPELREASSALAPRGVRLWCNTLDPVHPMAFDDTRASADPDGVWGTLLRSGIGAIQTDHAAKLSEYINARLE